jgi:hypothetical protein
LSTADKAPDQNIGSFSFLRVLQAKKRADERTRTADLLITSVRSVVAERCTGLQILHRQRVLCSLPCLGLQGITCGLGSNKGQVVSEVRAVCSWIIRRRFLCKSKVAGARGSAEPMRRSSDGRDQPLCKPFHPIHQGGYPCRTNTCSVDFYA